VGGKARGLGESLVFLSLSGEKTEEWKREVTNGGRSCEIASEHWKQPNLGSRDPVTKKKYSGSKGIKKSEQKLNRE